MQEFLHGFFLMGYCWCIKKLLIFFYIILKPAILMNPVQLKTNVFPVIFLRFFSQSLAYKSSFLLYIHHPCPSFLLELSKQC